MKVVYFFFILYIKLKLVDLCRFTLAVAVVQSATKEPILLLAILLAVTSDKWCWVQMLEKWSQMDGAGVGVRGWKTWAPAWLCLLDAVPLRLSGLSRRKVSWAGWMLEAWRIFFVLSLVLWIGSIRVAFEAPQAELPDFVLTPWKPGAICRIIRCVNASNAHTFPWCVQVPDLARASFLLAGWFSLKDSSARAGSNQGVSNARDVKHPCWGPLPVAQVTPSTRTWFPSAMVGRLEEGSGAIAAEWWNAVVWRRTAALEASWQLRAHGTAGACERISGILFPGIWQGCCVFPSSTDRRGL